MAGKKGGLVRVKGVAYKGGVMGGGASREAVEKGREVGVTTGGGGDVWSLK